MVRNEGFILPKADLGQLLHQPANNLTLPFVLY